MIIEETIPTKSNDSNNECSSGNFLRGTLSENPDIVGPTEIRGATVQDAESRYIGIRQAEKGNNKFSSGTKHGRSLSKFSRLMDTDRVARIVFDKPVVGMQTLVFDPKETCLALSREAIGPVEQSQIVTSGAERAIRRTRERLAETGNQFVYFGVRDMDSDGLSHWHIYWCADRTVIDIDSLDLLAGVESYVRNSPGALVADHSATEAVKWDPNPGQTVEAHGADISHGGPVHPSARYVASSLPHLGSVGEMEPRAVRHGAIECATPSKALKERNRNAVPDEIRRFSGSGSSR